MEEMNVGSGQQPTQDERVMGALAHAGIILPMWGLIGAVVIWATQREKSRFAAFQALQALVYQISLFALGVVGVGCYVGSFIVPSVLTYITAATIESASEGNNPVSFLLAMLSFGFPFCIVGLFLLLAGAFVVCGLYGAVRVIQGDDFRYPVIGRWLEKYLARQ